VKLKPSFSIYVSYKFLFPRHEYLKAGFDIKVSILYYTKAMGYFYGKDVAIRLVGAGSASFGFPILYDIARSEVLKSCRIVLVEVEAAFEGSRDKALQAMLLDPIVYNYKKAEACLNDLIEIHIDLLPSFSQ